MAEIKCIVETGVYVPDLEQAEFFYGTVLGLEQIDREVGRHVFYRVGNGVLLVFRPEATLSGETLPAHGGQGPGHFALGIDAADLGAWKERLAKYNIAIESEIDWPGGSRSVYFRDPGGNSVELVTPGLWGLPSGW